MNLTTTYHTSSFSHLFLPPLPTSPYPLCIPPIFMFIAPLSSCTACGTRVAITYCHCSSWPAWHCCSDSPRPAMRRIHWQQMQPRRLMCAPSEAYSGTSFRKWWSPRTWLWMWVCNRCFNCIYFWTLYYIYILVPTAIHGYAQHPQRYLQHSERTVQRSRSS